MCHSHGGMSTSPPSDTTDELVHLDLADGVATITLDSPANRNALSRRLVGDLHGALDDAETAIAAGDVRSIVLTHTPPAFCAGADLKERASGPPDSAPVVRAFERLMDAAVPTIAAVSGPARAGGIGLMASCDLVVVDQRRDVRPHRGPHRCRGGDHLGADLPARRAGAARRGLAHRRARSTPSTPSRSGS